MIRRVSLSLVTLALLGGFGACLGIGSTNDSSPQKPDASSGGSGGSTIGDGSFPDSMNGGSTSGGAAGAGGTTSTGGTSTGGTTSGGGTTGSGGTTSSGGASGLTLYTYATNNGTWTSVALSAAWAGPNAPANTDIAVVAQLEHYDRLIVFGTDGNFYLRADGVWQTPVPVTTKFPALAGLNVTGLYHVASPPGAAIDESLTFIANPTAVLYDYGSNDAVVYVDKVTMTDDPPPAAPQGSGHAIFSFEMRDPTLVGQAAYYEFYTYYDDGDLYQFDAAFVWVKWPILQSPFWSGKSGAPDPTTLTAAWYDEKYERAMFVGP